jgi:hypothetical protein
MMQDDKPSDFPAELIASLSPIELDRIRVADVSDVTGNRFPLGEDGTFKHVISFGNGAHWTMVYSADKRPIGCEFEGVRFETLDDHIWVMPNH